MGHKALAVARHSTLLLCITAEDALWTGGVMRHSSPSQLVVKSLIAPVFAPDDLIRTTLHLLSLFPGANPLYTRTQFVVITESFKKVIGTSILYEGTRATGVCRIGEGSLSMARNELSSQTLYPSVCWYLTRRNSLTCG